MSKNGNVNWLIAGVLIIMAIFLMTIVFLVDIYSDPSLTVGVLYCIVVLYSWLLPFPRSSIYTAFICSGLIIFAQSQSVLPEQDSLLGLNVAFSLIVVWVSATLVSVAKRSFDSMDRIREFLEDQVEDRTRKLNEKVTALKWNEKKLKDKNKELEQYTYIASHDLQEPLRTLLSMTEILDAEHKQSLNEEGKEVLGYINDNVDRMKSNVTALLEYGRFGKGQKLEFVDVNEALENTMKLLSKQIAENNATIIYNDLPVIQAFPNDFEVLMQNLISNAIKFKRKEENPKVEISAEETEDFFAFTIKDNGIGIPTKYLDRIFNIFQRLHGRDEYEGHGIGLAHCKKIVEVHGGKIQAESVEGVGSTFRFTIRKQQES